MLLNLKKYYRPRSLEGALQLLNADPTGCFILAGGTYLNASAPQEVEEVVDISRLKLNAIQQSELMIHIGATVTIQSILDDSKLGKFANGILTRACRSNSISRMIRNQRTVGGELIAGARYSDLAAVLLALEARVKFMQLNMEEGRKPVAALWATHGNEVVQRRAAPLGLILEIILPKPARTFSCAFERIAQIESQPSMISAAACVEFSEGNVCAGVRVALGAFAETPERWRSLEAQLQGQPLTSELIESVCKASTLDVQPMGDSRATPDYRRRVTPRLVQRVLHQCLGGG